MLPMEMFGAGGSLLMLLLIPNAGKMPVRECTISDGNGDGSRLLRPDDGGAGPSAVGTVGNGGSAAAPIFVWCWILNYVIFVLIFDFAVCCHSAYF